MMKKMIPAKHQHVSIVILSMLSWWYSLKCHCHGFRLVCLNIHAGTRRKTECYTGELVFSCHVLRLFPLPTPVGQEAQTRVDIVNPAAHCNLCAACSECDWPCMKMYSFWSNPTPQSAAGAPSERTNLCLAHTRHNGNIWLRPVPRCRVHRSRALRLVFLYTNTPYIVQGHISTQWLFHCKAPSKVKTPQWVFFCLSYYKTWCWTTHFTWTLSLDCLSNYYFQLQDSAHPHSCFQSLYYLSVDVLERKWCHQPDQPIGILKVFIDVP